MAPSIYPLVDRIMGGTLTDYLRTERDKGNSFESIARSLSADHAVIVSGETIRQWCSDVLALAEGQPDTQEAS